MRTHMHAYTLYVVHLPFHKVNTEFYIFGGGYYKQNLYFVCLKVPEMFGTFTPR